jgi:hypothetical protein
MHVYIYIYTYTYVYIYIHLTRRQIVTVHTAHTDVCSFVYYTCACQTNCSEIYCLAHLIDHHACTHTDCLTYVNKMQNITYKY